MASPFSLKSSLLFKDFVLISNSSGFGISFIILLTGFLSLAYNMLKTLPSEKQTLYKILSLQLPYFLLSLKQCQHSLFPFCPLFIQVLFPSNLTSDPTTVLNLLSEITKYLLIINSKGHVLIFVMLQFSLSLQTFFPLMSHVHLVLTIPS